MNLWARSGVCVQEGGEDVLDSLIQQYGKRLYGLCLALCADPNLADDLYQDTWLRALQHFSQYDPSRPFEPWLTRICVNRYRSVLRRLARSPVLGFGDSEAKERLLQSVPAPEQPDYSALHEAINALPEKLRLTVILFYFQDMDLNDTARALNIPPGTVKSRLHKARQLLKEVLTDEADI